MTTLVYGLIATAAALGLITLLVNHTARGRIGALAILATSGLLTFDIHRETWSAEKQIFHIVAVTACSAHVLISLYWLVACRTPRQETPAPPSVEFLDEHEVSQ